MGFIQKLRKYFISKKYRNMNLKYTVRYLNSANNEIIAPEKTVEGLDFGAFVTEIAPEFFGFEAKQEKVSFEINQESQFIDIYYDRCNDFSYIVKYVDKSNYNEIWQHKCVKNLPFGVEMVECAVKIKGYICLTEVITVQVASRTTEVVFEYEKRRDLTGCVVYVEKESGKEIHPAYTLDGLIYREKICRHALMIPGYVPDAEVMSLWVKTCENKIVFTYEKRSDLSYCVRYIDAESGLDIVEEKIVDGQTFDTIVAETAVDILGYVSKENCKAIHIGAENNEVIFEYQKRSDLTCDIEYIDQKTGENLLPKTVVKGLVYNAELCQNAPDIRGYVPEIESIVTTISAQGNQITFAYTRRNNLSYIVRYVDRDSGLDIAPVKTVDDQVFGTEVRESALDISGYTQCEDNGSLTLDVEGNEMLFLYDRRRNIEYTVEYCEEETGNKLAEDKQVKDQLYGVVVCETSIDIDGYNLLSEHEQKMTLEATDNRLVFYYKKIPMCSYDVWYLETDTKRIIAPKRCVENQLVGTNVIEYAIGIEGYTPLPPAKQMIHMECEENEFRFFYEKNSTQKEPHESTELPMVEEKSIADELVDSIKAENHPVVIAEEQDQELEEVFDVCGVRTFSKK